MLPISKEILFILKLINLIEFYLQIFDIQPLEEMNLLTNICNNNVSIDSSNYNLIIPQLSECEIIFGNLIIETGDSDLIELFSLNHITQIKGHLIIKNNANLKNIIHLNSLQLIQGDLKIINNLNLEKISFKKLNKIEGNLIISQNYKLKIITNFLLINYIPKSLLIVENYELSSIIGFSFLKKIKENFIISSSNILKLQGLNNLYEIGGYFAIERNENLQNLNDLRSLEHIGTDFWFQYNHSVYNFEGLNIKYIGNDIRINYNLNLYKLGAFNYLNKINGTLFIKNNPKLSSLNGFNNLYEIGQNFELFGSISNQDVTFNLYDLQGLHNLKTVKGTFKIINYSSLQSLNGLNSLNTCKDIIINNNDELMNIENLILINYISDLFITNNYSLTNLNGLQSLKTCKNIRINGNQNLESLSYLDNLKYIYEDIYIMNNNNLPECSGEYSDENINNQYGSIYWLLNNILNVNNGSIFGNTFYEG